MRTRMKKDELPNDESMTNAPMTNDEIEQIHDHLRVFGMVQGFFRHSSFGH
jgi:hypothetical protein